MRRKLRILAVLLALTAVFLPSFGSRPGNAQTCIQDSHVCDPRYVPPAPCCTGSCLLALPRCPEVLPVSRGKRSSSDYRGGLGDGPSSPPLKVCAQQAPRRLRGSVSVFVSAKRELATVPSWNSTGAVVWTESKGAIDDSTAPDQVTLTIVCSDENLFCTLGNPREIIQRHRLHRPRIERRFGVQGREATHKKRNRLRLPDGLKNLLLYGHLCCQYMIDFAFKVDEHRSFPGEMGFSTFRELILEQANGLHSGA